MPKYPNIKVKLVGEDGNAYSIMARVRSALSKHLKKSLTPTELKSELDLYIKESTSGNYDNLLQTAMNWVNCK